MHETGIIVKHFSLFTILLVFMLIQHSAYVVIKGENNTQLPIKTILNKSIAK